METKPVSTQTLQRLPTYLNYLKSLPKDGAVNISATMIAEALGMNDVQVRKDLAMVSAGGRPKIGYITENLICDIEQFLGYGEIDSAVLVGVGFLGRALLSYDGFSKYGLDIMAAFDTDKKIIGTIVNGREVLPPDKLNSFCRQQKIKIGIITVPATEAQQVCESLIDSNVKAIWNFAPVYLNIHQNVLIKNENMAYSLAMLSKHLKEKLLKSK